MSNSSLVTYVKKSPFNSGQRKKAIDRITPHCVVGQCVIENLGGWFSNPSAKCSCNYGIGKDGRIGLIVDEQNRSWCTSSSANDNRAVTIECASDTFHPYAMTDAVYQSLIKLCADICKRNGKTRLIWIDDKAKALAYNPKSNEMLITVHRWFANKACPGDWLYSRLGDLADRVNKILGTTATATTPGTFKPYTVRVRIDDLNIREGAGVAYNSVGFVPPGVYTIVAEQKVNNTMWGKLKSGVGWICLAYAEKC